MQALARISLSRQTKLLKQQKLRTISIFRKKTEYVVKSFLPDIVIPNIRFVDRIWKDFGSFKNHVAVECAETKRSLTYQQLQRSSAIYATSLHKKLGLKPGDVIAVMLPNCPEFAVVAIGTPQAGCVLSPVNPLYKELEITHQMSTTEPKVVITIPECYDAVVNSVNISKIKARIVLVASPDKPIADGAVRFADIANDGEMDYSLLDTIKRSLEDTAVIPFSSGTTGLPKGVEISNKNLLASFEMMSDERTCFVKPANGEFQDIVPCVLPFYHIYGLMIVLYKNLSNGCKLITLPKFSMDSYFDVLKKQNPSLLYIVPPLALLLGRHPGVTEEHFRNVRHIICGAAPISASDVEAVLQKSKKRIEFNQGFGTTETTCAITSTLINYKEIDYSACGVPMASMSIKFADPQTGSYLPIGETGEICAKGPVVMKGYHKNEKATDECLTDDGFYKTGDLGHYKPGVGLFVTDRIKELIKVKGMQVAPAELEGILRSYRSIQDAAVIGIPHDLAGEVPRAFIVLRQGQQTSPDEIKKFVASRVAEYKKIEEVVFIDSIPKTTTGKILRKELKKL